MEEEKRSGEHMVNISVVSNLVSTKGDPCCTSASTSFIVSPGAIQWHGPYRRVQKWYVCTLRATPSATHSILHSISHNKFMNVLQERPPSLEASDARTVPLPHGTPGGNADLPAITLPPTRRNGWFCRRRLPLLQVTPYRPAVDAQLAAPPGTTSPPYLVRTCTNRIKSNTFKP